MLKYFYCHVEATFVFYGLSMKVQPSNSANNGQFALSLKGLSRKKEKEREWGESQA